MKQERWNKRDTAMLRKYPEYFTISDEALDNLRITPESLTYLEYLTEVKCMNRKKGPLYLGKLLTAKDKGVLKMGRLVEKKKRL